MGSTVGGGRSGEDSGRDSGPLGSGGAEAGAAPRARRGALAARRPLALLAAIAAALLGAASPALAEPTSLPAYVSTPSGWMHVEDRYVPGVTEAELGWFAAGRGATECLSAQAVAARTFLLRYLNNNGHTRTIPALGPSFQAWTANVPSSTRQASQRVRGQVLTHQGLVIYANYAAGAWPLDGNGFPFAPSTYGYAPSQTWSGIRSLFLQRNASSAGASAWSSQVYRRNSWAWTYVLNTHNEGRSGAAVTPTIHASSGPRNRGGFGQYRALWLDLHRGYGYQRLLRAFYGEDVTIAGAPAAAPSPTPSSGGGAASFTSGSGGAGAADLVVRALAVLSPSGDAGAVGVGQDVGLRASVLNAGAAMSATVPVRVAYVAGGRTIGSGVATLRLGAGQSAEIGLDTGAWRPSEPGAYSIEARVNDDGRLPESSRANNARTASVRAFQALRVTGSTLNVRAGPSTGYGVLGQVRAGDLVAARARSGDWFQVDFAAGASGWIHGGYVAPAGRVTAVRITASALNVRTGPAVTSPRIGGASAGQVFVRRGGQSGWHQIFWGGTSGWVSGTSSDLSVTLGL